MSIDDRLADSGVVAPSEAGRKDLLLPIFLVSATLLAWAQLNSRWGRLLEGEVSGLAAVRATAPIVALAIGAGVAWATRGAVDRRLLDRSLPLLLLGGYGLVGIFSGVLLGPSPAASLYWGIAYLVPVGLAALFLTDGTLLGAGDLFYLTLAIAGVVATVLLVFFALETRFLRALLDLDLVRIGTTYGDPPTRALLINANGVGRFVAITLLVAVSFLFTGRSRWGRLASLAAVLAFASLLVYTQSRGAIAGFLAGVFLLVGLHTSWRLTGAGFASVALAGAAFLRHEILDFLSRGSRWSTLETLSGRTKLWADLWPHFLDSPLIGWGFRADRLLADVEAHNALVDALVTSGILGTLLFLGAWALVWSRVIRGLQHRFDGVGEGDRNVAILATAVLAFLTARAIPESTGSYFGVDLLILAPTMAVLYSLEGPNADGTGKRKVKSGVTQELETVDLERGTDTFDVLGTPIAAVEPDDVLGFVDDTIAADGDEYVCVCSVNNVMSARKDEELADIHREAGLCIPDGFYLAKIGRRRRPGEVERIRGTDLTWRLAEHAAQEGYSIFLYGAAPGVPEQMAENLREYAPRLEIAGMHSPPFRPTTPEEDAEEVAMINEADPDILLVGLPTPKQDRWMADHVDRVDANVMFGVGAAFDFVAGNKDEAPRWIRENGFEWLYRFTQEPTRLWRRVIVQGPKFVSLVAADALTDAGDG